MKFALAIIALVACVPFGLFLYWSYQAIEEFTAPTGPLPPDKQYKQSSGDGGGAGGGGWGDGDGGGGDGGGGGGD